MASDNVTETTRGSVSWRSLTLKTMAAVGLVAAGLGLTTLPAYANVVSASYTIGLPVGAVSGVSVSPTSASQDATTSFTIEFTSQAALSGSSGDSVTITPSEALGSPPASVDLLDFGSNCLQSGTAGTGGAGSVAVTGLTIELASSCTINARTTVEVDFNAAAPGATGPLTFSVSTSANGTPAISNPVTVGASGPTLTAGSVAFGANTSYNIGNTSVVDLSSGDTTLVLGAQPTIGTELITFYGGPSGYSVVYAPPGGSATPDPVVSVTLGSGNTSVTLTLADPIATGGTLSITATGSNPPASSSPQADDITVTPGNGTTQVTNSMTFGSSVRSVTVSPSTLSAGATATYSVSFKASSQVVSGGDIYLEEADGPTNFSTVTAILIEDTTQPWHFLASGATLASGSAAVPLQDTVNAGDSLVITLENVTNPPSAGTISDFSVSTSTDPVPADAPTYSIESSSSAGVMVSVDPSTTGTVATYGISGLVASSALAGGSSTIGIDAPSGTVFPANAGFYSVADLTTRAGSGTVTTISGGGTNDVTLTVPSSIGAGDNFSLTIEDVINPNLASSVYTISVIGDVTGAAPPPAFPGAGLSYPNGALVNFSHTVYVMAGGHAFGVPSPADLTALQKIDHAVTVDAPSGATPPATSPRVGTLLSTRPLNGSPTVYVVGGDGELHGFATPEQFVNDGYDPALVVTVPSLGGLTVGAPAGQEGAAANALSTSANGTIVQSSGTFYVLAGGRALGIPNVATLIKIRKADKAKPLSGLVSAAQRSATVADGTLLTLAGSVYVSYQGNLFEFRSMDQLDTDGYAGTAAVPVPSTGGVMLVTDYSGR